MTSNCVFTFLPKGRGWRGNSEVCGSVFSVSLSQTRSALLVSLLLVWKERARGETITGGIADFLFFACRLTVSHFQQTGNGENLFLPLSLSFFFSPSDFNSFSRSSSFFIRSFSSCSSSLWGVLNSDTFRLHNDSSLRSYPSDFQHIFWFAWKTHYNTVIHVNVRLLFALDVDFENLHTLFIKSKTAPRGWSRHFYSDRAHAFEYHPPIIALDFDFLVRNCLVLPRVSNYNQMKWKASRYRLARRNLLKHMMCSVSPAAAAAAGNWG